MIYFLKGIITLIKDNNVVIDVHDVGYSLIVAKASSFIINKEYTIYTHQIFKENEQFLIGFKTLEEKKLFLNLLRVKGLGPKGIINILNQAEIEQINEAILYKNVLFFKKLNGVGSKLANQIILDAKAESLILDTNKNSLMDALKSLGFKQPEINRVINETNFSNLNQEESIKLALSKLRKA